MSHTPQSIDDLHADVNLRRRFGLDDYDIAQAMQIPPHIVKSVPLPRPQPQRQRAIQHMQLMKMQHTLMPKVEAGDHEAIQLLLKVQKREADLLGLDAPRAVINHNFSADIDIDGLTPEQVKELSIDQIKHMLLVKLGEAAIDVTPAPSDSLPDS